MTKSLKQDYIDYRIASAKETLNAAHSLARDKHWNSVINRLYYVCFYAISALLFKNEINAHSHSGLKHQFSLHFIKTSKLDKKFGKLLTELYDWRQKGDYDNIFDYDSESVKPLFESVLDMINQINTEIKRSI